MRLFNNRLQKVFQTKSTLKAITSMNNANFQQVVKIVKAVELSNATYLDVASNTKLVKVLKSFSSLSICISSIDSIDICNEFLLGADLVEIGNYDFFYDKSIYLSKKQILELSKKIESLAKNIDICITIPYYLNLVEQITLVKDFKVLGINIVQTEGIFKVNLMSLKMHSTKFTTPFYNLFIPSLLFTYIISEFVNLYVIASSSIYITSSIYQRGNIISMSKYINQTYKFLSLLSFINPCANLENYLHKSLVLSQKEIF
uniref:Uncharacterized protein ycf23 n=1 Tax=Vertebrata lanosa TaxID=1261582 RepID=A0A0B5VQU9_9FLOR|nr:hypothetical protein [Vertebrata lanosa]AJH66007.1 hypothetical protein [Vertebrata lanosa]